MKYLIYTKENDNTEFTLYVDSCGNSDCETKEQAINFSEKLRKNKYYKDDIIKISTWEQVCINAEYEEGDAGGGIVNVTVEVDGKEFSDEFIVQLSGGEHLTQMGCWLLASEEDGDTDLSTYRNGIFNDCDIISAAEQSYIAWVAEKTDEGSENGETWEYFDSFDDATCSATSSTCIKADESSQGRFRVYIDNSGFTQPNDYSSMPEFDIEYFDNKDEYLSWKKHYQSEDGAFDRQQTGKNI